MSRNIAFVFPLCLFFTSVFGQTASELEKEYGAPIRTYSVSESIWMTPEYGTDGKVCAMSLYPKRIDDKTNYLGDRLNEWELDSVLNKLAPPYTRGKKTWYGLSLFVGGAMLTLYGYEHVSFLFVAPSNTAGKAAEKEAGELKKTEDKEKDEEHYSPAEIVRIRWKDRKCKGNK